MKKEVYLVSYEFYGDWALDCGACDYVGVYERASKVIDKVNNLILEEFMQCDERVLECGNTKFNKDNLLDGVNKVTELFKDDNFNANNQLFINVFQNEDMYDLGNDNGAIVITKMEVK